METRIWKPVITVFCFILLLTLTACTAEPAARDTFVNNAFEGTEPVKQSINGLNIIIDPRIELLAAAQYISKYNDIVCRKNNPVSPVRNGVCMECGFKLNAILFENLKKGSKINLCDHCGRILYIE
jgi:DNA-directed RNA polymerase subunit RPC12/RpoP